MENTELKNLIESVGFSNLSGASLRAYREITARLDKLAQVKLYHNDRGSYSTIHNQYLTHFNECTNSLSRLALYKLHTSTNQLTSDWNRYNRNNPWWKVANELHFPKPKRSDDSVSRYVRAAVYMSIKSRLSQKISRELELAANNGWYVVFDTLTLSNGMIKNFYADTKLGGNKAPLTRYIEDVSHSVMEIAKNPRKRLGSLKSKDEDLHISDVYRYAIVPEYGSETGRLHWHVIHMMRDLPRVWKLDYPYEDSTPETTLKLIGDTKPRKRKTTGKRQWQCVDSKTHIDPNTGNVALQNRTEIAGFKQFWSYGDSNPIAVRHHRDAFGDILKWAIPKQKCPETGLLTAPDLKNSLALASYVSKYMAKAVDELETQGDKWNEHVTQFSVDTRSKFRVTTCRGLGYSQLTRGKLDIPDLISLTKISTDCTRYHYLVKTWAKSQLREIINTQSHSVNDLINNKPEVFEFMNHVRNSFTPDGAAKLPDKFKQLELSEITPIAFEWLDKHKLLDIYKPKNTTHAAGK